MTSNEYFPLHANNWWLYQTEIGNIEVRVTGTEDVTEGLCYILEISIDGQSIQKENYILDQNALWLCARNFEDGVFVYDPPYPMLIFPLEIRKNWEWKGSCGIYPMEISISVIDKETISVPAGVYNALKLLIEEKNPYGIATSLRWYAKGIGVVREESSSDYIDFTAELQDFYIKEEQIDEDIDDEESEED